MLAWVSTLREALEKINIRGVLRFGEPMSGHTSFGIGGPADAYALPADVEDALLLLRGLDGLGLPYRVVGGGSNLLVSDLGYRGVVVDCAMLNQVYAVQGGLYAQAGAAMSDILAAAAAFSLSGLEDFGGLPGSLGGAAYMNARCYELEFSDRLGYLDYYLGGRPCRVERRDGDWGYKSSPFQPGAALAGGVILGAGLVLSPGDGALIRAAAESRRADRQAKGHFRLPCAGSVFKNNRDFGQPSGRILDELGLRGRRLGGASVADYHANIFVNSGGAKASDVMGLIRLAKGLALSQRGIKLECELEFLGDFGSEGEIDG